MASSMKTCIGIDVAASAKGFHAVALRGNTVIDKVRARDPVVLAKW